MSITSKISALQNEIYTYTATRLAREGVPSDVGKLVMDGVYNLFISAAYNTQAVYTEHLEAEVEALKAENEKLKAEKEPETEQKTPPKDEKRAKT